MIDKIIKDENLTCTETEFNEYMDSVPDLEVTVSCIKYTFDIPYNGVLIENKTGDDNAIYYVLNILTTEGYRTYLQPIVPFISGLIAITNDNFEEISQGHIDDIVKNIQNGNKFQKTIEHFKLV